MRLAIVVLFMVCAGASAQESAGQFAHGAAISVEGADSHYRFPMPAAAYLGITRGDLGDLRVFNAAGEPVPHAFAPLRPKAIAPETKAAKLFPLYGEESKGLDGVDVRLEQTTRGTTRLRVASKPSSGSGRKLLGYLIDTGEEPPALAALRLDWAAGSDFTGLGYVEGSDDLKRWRSLADGAPIVFLEHDGARLEQSRLPVAGAKSRYLRLSFTGLPRTFALKEVRLELPADAWQPARDWLGVPGTHDPKRAGEYLFDTGGHFPVDRVRFALPQQNTVAQGRLFARGRAEDAWQPVTSVLLYRLLREGREFVNPDVVVPADSRRYWMLKVDQRGGGLGAGEVRLEFGWIPHEVVFAARGAAPFSLAYGMKGAKPAAMPIATVLPGYKVGEPIPAKLAAVSVDGPLVRQEPSLLKDPAGFLRAAVASGEAKRWALWAALVVGVLVIAGMAFGLLRQLGRVPQNRDSSS
jgi:uncharacterized protein DUF3999